MSTTKVSGQLINDLGTNYSGGFVNKFRNVSMDVAQRGTSGTITAGTPAYALDGWIISSTGANASWSQATFTTAGYPNYNCFVITGNTSMTDTLVKQRIESFIASQLLSNGQSITVQFAIYNNTGATITPTLTVKVPTAQDNYASTTTAVSAVSLQSATNGTETVLAYTFAAPNGGWRGLEVTLDFGSALNSNTKSVYLLYADIRATPGVSIGLNSSPPTVELRPIATELSLCQRYYYDPANGGSTVTVGFFSYGAGGFTAAGGVVSFPTIMRATPTIVLRNQSYTNASALTVDISGPNGFNCYASITATNSYVTRFNFTASAEL